MLIKQKNQLFEKRREKEKKMSTTKSNETKLHRLPWDTRLKTFFLLEPNISMICMILLMLFQMQTVHAFMLNFQSNKIKNDSFFCRMQHSSYEIHILRLTNRVGNCFVCVCKMNSWETGDL